MSKQVLRNTEFNAAAGTITFNDFDEDMDIARLALVTNVTTGQLLYNFMDPSSRASFDGNVLTLDKDTSGMEGHIIRVDYDTSFGDASYDRIVVGNARQKFRDGFAQQGTVQPNPDSWILEEDTPGTHFIDQGGDAQGSSYLRISLNPFVESEGLSLTSRRRFAFPMRVGWGISASQRISGQEFFVGMVAVDEDGNIPKIEPVADKPITGAVATVTSNVATFTLAQHGLKGNDRINIIDCADHRMNVGPAIVTVATADTFTVPITITNGSYSTVGGIVRTIDPLRYVKNGMGYLWGDSTSVTTASIVARRNGAKFRSTSSTVATTTAAQTSTSPYTDAFNSAGNQELYLSMDEAVARSYASDSNASTNGYVKFTQGIPDEELQYALHFRARILAGTTKIAGRIVSVTKTASSTATVTTDVPHGLAVGDFVQGYGVRDQTNFGNQSTWIAVASVPSETTYTLTWGGTATATSGGGAVWVNHGQVTAPGVLGQAVQSISRTNGVMTLIGNTTWSGPLPGEYLQVHGLDQAPEYEGAYKTLRVSGTTLELEAPGENFTSINTGGAVFRRTDIRLHFARVMDYTRLVAEIVGGKGNTSDANGSVPVSLASGTIAASQSSGANTVQWNAAGWGGFLVADIASAAITSTATSGTITPAVTNNIGTYAHSFNVIVTAMSGTNPTLDVAIEESLDNGTNWVRIYEFPRITATGAYTSPLIRAQWGTRYRYVRTITGTSPSFTMALNRLQFSSLGEIHKQFFDRTISTIVTNSSTPTYNVDGCNFFQVVVSLGAATTPPVMQFQGSEDGALWYNIGAQFTPAANTNTVQVYQDIMPRFCRTIIATAGAAVTQNWVSTKGVRK
jgi:hypothetical protein